MLRETEGEVRVYLGLDRRMGEQGKLKEKRRRMKNKGKTKKKNDKGPQGKERHENINIKNVCVN